MLRPIDNTYRPGVNMTIHKGGVSFWYNMETEDCTIPLTETFVKEAIEEKLRREYFAKEGEE